jgi:hypothetical protein
MLRDDSERVPFRGPSFCGVGRHRAVLPVFTYWLEDARCPRTLGLLGCLFISASGCCTTPLEAVVCCSVLLRSVFECRSQRHPLDGFCIRDRFFQEAPKPPNRIPKQSQTRPPRQQHKRKLMDLSGEPRKRALGMSREPSSKGRT